MTWGARQPDQDQDRSTSAWQFSLMARLGEVSAELRSLRQDMHGHLNGLPERMARQMVLHIQQAKLCRPKPQRRGEDLPQLTLLLRNALPYAVLAWRIGLLAALWSTIATGTYSAEQIGKMSAEMLKALLTD